MLNQPINEQEQLIDQVISAERAVAEYSQYDLNSDIFSYTFFDQRIAIWRKYYAEYAGALEERRKNEFAAIWS